MVKRVDLQTILIQITLNGQVPLRYLNVPYSEKDEVKALGARWDIIRKMWYVTDVTLQKNAQALSRWVIPDCDMSSLLNGDAEPKQVERPLQAMQEHDDAERLRGELLRGI